MGFAIIAITWFSVCMKIQPDSGFQISIVPPYAVLVNVMICRVFRNTKLGLYTKVPVQYNDPKSQIDTAPNSIISWNSDMYSATDPDSNTVIPIQIEVNQVIVVESETDHTRSKRPNATHFLDFGMV